MSHWSYSRTSIFYSQKFFETELNKRFVKCKYFETINNLAEVNGMCGVIVSRILINIFKKNQILYDNIDHQKMYIELFNIINNIF